MAEHLERDEDKKVRDEQLRAMSRKLLMEFADEDDGIARPLAAMAKSEQREPPKR
jgi:hypothetical protein